MHFDFKAYDFADTGSARDAIAVVDARGVLRRMRCRRRSRPGNAGAAAGVPMVISGHKETAFLVAMLGCLRLRVPFVPVDVINPPERIKRIGELVRAGLRYDAQAQASNRAAPAPRRCARPDWPTSCSRPAAPATPRACRSGAKASRCSRAGSVTACAWAPRPRSWTRCCSASISRCSTGSARWNWAAPACCARARPSPSAAPSCSTWRTPASRSGRPRHPSCGSSCSTRTSTAPACLACASSCSAPSRSPALAEELWQRFPDARIINSYGPTEATCSTTWVEIDAALRQAAPNPFPIGRAKPYADVFIDQGEICIAGDHVMRGYLNRPDLNASRMFTRGGKRGYRSGDLGEIDGQA